MTIDRKLYDWLVSFELCVNHIGNVCAWTHPDIFSPLCPLCCFTKITAAKIIQFPIPNLSVCISAPQHPMYNKYMHEEYSEFVRQTISTSRISYSNLTKVCTCLDFLFFFLITISFLRSEMFQRCTLGSIKKSLQVFLYFFQDLSHLKYLPLI